MSGPPPGPGPAPHGTDRLARTRCMLHVVCRACVVGAEEGMDRNDVVHCNEPVSLAVELVDESVYQDSTSARLRAAAFTDTGLLRTALVRPH